jgi:hypothetical protein
LVAIRLSFVRPYAEFVYHSRHDAVAVRAGRAIGRSAAVKTGAGPDIPVAPAAADRTGSDADSTKSATVADVPLNSD